LYYNSGLQHFLCLLAPFSLSLTPANPTTLRSHQIVTSPSNNLVYLLFIVELATCFDPAGLPSGLYVNQVKLKKTAYIFGIPKMYADF